MAEKFPVLVRGELHNQWTATDVTVFEHTWGVTGCGKREGRVDLLRAWLLCRDTVSYTRVTLLGDTKGTGYVMTNNDIDSEQEEEAEKEEG